MLQAMLSDSLSDNIVFSPYSILTALCVLADGAGGKTRQEIVNTLSSEIPEDIKSGEGDTFRLFRDRILDHDDRGDQEYKWDGVFETANALCIKERYAPRLTQSFLDIFRSQYAGEVFSGQHLAKDANSWVSRKTKGIIPKILDEGSSGEMDACLLNTVAFIKGWSDEYEKEDIEKDRDFYCADGSVRKVTMLHSIEDCYTETDDYQAFTKDYADPRFAYLAIVPKDGDTDSSPDRMEELVGKVGFSHIFQSMDYQRVYVTMPEYKAEFSCELSHILGEMGIRDTFSPEADFSPMCDDDFYVQKILHRARISVTRKGTEAAAATACLVLAGCLMPEEPKKSIVLDHPFLYAVMDKKTGIPVFAGCINTIGRM